MRPSRPAPDTRDDRDAPLLWVRDGAKTIIKFGKTEAKYFSLEGWTRIWKIHPTGKSVGSKH
jgi:hypothetical protein